MKTAAPAELIGDLALHIYSTRIERLMRPEDHGKYLALDIDSGEYELDASDYQAIMRLRGRLPGSKGFLLRVGFPTTIRLGPRN